MFSLIKRKGSYDERVKLMIETHSTGNTPFLSPARPPRTRPRVLPRMRGQPGHQVPESGDGLLTDSRPRFLLLAQSPDLCWRYP